MLLSEKRAIQVQLAIRSVLLVEDSIEFQSWATEWLDGQQKRGNGFGMSYAAQCAINAANAFLYSVEAESTAEDAGYDSFPVLEAIRSGEGDGWNEAIMVWVNDAVSESRRRLGGDTDELARLVRNANTLAQLAVHREAMRFFS